MWKLVLAGVKLNKDFDKKVVDSKIHQIERHFHARESSRHSGATDLPFWPLEDRIAAVIGRLSSLVFASLCLAHTNSPPLHTLTFSLSQATGQWSSQPRFLRSGKMTTRRTTHRVMCQCLQHRVVATQKKLTSKPSKADQVLTYLKNSVSTCLGQPVTSVFLLHSGLHACHLLQDKVATEIHNENRVYKKQLIGLLAKVKQKGKKQPNSPACWAHMNSCCSVDCSTKQLCFIQMVGASPEEVDAMGKEWEMVRHWWQISLVEYAGRPSVPLCCSMCAHFSSSWTSPGSCWLRFWHIWIHGRNCIWHKFIHTFPSSWRQNGYGRIFDWQTTGCSIMTHLCSSVDLPPRLRQWWLTTQVGHPGTLLLTQRACLQTCQTSEKSQYVPHIFNFVTSWNTHLKLRCSSSNNVHVLTLNLSWSVHRVGACHSCAPSTWEESPVCPAWTCGGCRTICHIWHSCILLQLWVTFSQKRCLRIVRVSHILIVLHLSGAWWSGEHSSTGTHGSSLVHSWVHACK